MTDQIIGLSERGFDRLKGLAGRLDAQFFNPVPSGETPRSLSRQGFVEGKLIEDLAASSDNGATPKFARMSPAVARRLHQLEGKSPGRAGPLRSRSARLSSREISCASC